MKFNKAEIKELIDVIGFKPQEGEKDIYYKNYPEHDDYMLKICFDKEKIKYGLKINLGDWTTSNFENSENFVVLECIDKVLQKGYAPERLFLEYKWPMGKKEKGKLDIFIRDKDDNAYLMIECKTWGEEYDKEKKKMQRDGGQLFSYFQQDKAAKYLCLYTSRLSPYSRNIEYQNSIVKVEEHWRELANQKEVYEHWNKNFKDNGIFDEWANAYDIEIKVLTRDRLKELTEEDSGRIFNQFAEILRHNIVSDKPNAFNKIFNLFLCKIVDEDRNPDEELKFQWIETDSDEELQKRLSDLYKEGMKEYLTKEVTDYNDEQISEKLYELEPEIRDQIKDMFTRMRLYKNNEFAFKEVFDEKSFRQNAVVVREVVELLQPYQIRYSQKQQFLGDFFELLLSTGIKQEAGQFFTPVPIAKFIVSSLPIYELIEAKINNDETNFLPYIIDYAAGSGHFIVEAIDEVQHIIENINHDKQRPSVKNKLKSWSKSKFDWAYEYVYGIEADYRLVKTAKVSCFLNGDGLANVIHADGLDNFSKSIDYKDKLKKISTDCPQDNAQFDILIANPPYSVSAFKNTLKAGEESFELFNRLTDDSSEIECLFIERAKQLLKPSGLAGIILPGSILSNPGIYMHTREIILKYFNIKAIAEFGPSTFMATNINTVVMFLERRINNEWKKIEQIIKNFFDKPEETNFNSIEKPFGKYVTEVFEGIELSDYISLIKKCPNKSLQEQELFIEYKTWFKGLTEVKQLKEKKLFINKIKSEQQAELDKLFYEKVFSREQDRMLYFFLAYPQKTLLIITGDKTKQEEKDFIGYEFSNRRGHEGIRMYRDENGKLTTKLYDEENRLNPEKVNYYIYKAFTKQKININSSLQNNLFESNLINLINFKDINFLKSINLTLKKKNKIESKWELVRLNKILSVLETGNRPKGGVSRNKGGVPNLGGEHIGLKGELILDNLKFVSADYFKRTNKGIIEPNDILICKDGALTGKVAIIPNPSPFKNGMVNEHVFRLRTNNEAYQKYLFIFLYSELGQNLIKTNITGNAQSGLNSTNLSNMQVPLPPKSIQEKIIAEIEIIEQNENIWRNKIRDINQKLNFVLHLNGRIENYKFSDIAILEYGKSLPKDIRKDGEYPVMGSNGNDGTHNDYLIEGPCIIIGRKGSAGKINFVNQNCYPIDTTFYVNFNKDKVLIKYLFYLLKELNLENLAKGKGIGAPGLNRNNVHKLKISIHPISEQMKIVTKIEELETEIMQLRGYLSTSNSEKEEILKQYLSV